MFVQTNFLRDSHTGSLTYKLTYKRKLMICRPDSDLDPRSDRLMKFEGESGFMSGLFLWIVVFAIVYAVYSVVMKNSASINQSVLMARRMMHTSAAVVAPHKKERTN